MEKIKTNSGFKKFRKIFFRTIVGLILLLLLVSIALSLPEVQTKIAKFATEKINKNYGTHITIDAVAITFFGGIKLKKVLILDHHSDTLIYSQRIKITVLDFKKVMDGNLIFGDLSLDNFYLQIKNYKGENETSLDKFIAAFDNGKPSSGKFLMTSKNIFLTKSRFEMLDENKANPKDLDFTHLEAKLKNFKIKGPDVTTNIVSMTFHDHRGVTVDNLLAAFTYTKKNIRLEQLEVLTKESFLKGTVILKYNKNNHDFSDFNNRVKFDIAIDSATLSTNDIRHFYNELDKNQKFYLSSKIKGTLNNFYATNMYLQDRKNSIIKGDVNVKNLFPHSPGNFYMKGNFGKIASNYNDLTKLLPNILGKKLPSSLAKLGQFNYAGKVELSQSYINTNFVMNTALGIVESDLHMSNLTNIDNAKYDGKVILDGFDIGAMIDNKSIGKVSLNLDVTGKGFTRKYLNTTIVGDVFQLKYNGYNYTKIIVDGSFKDPLFKGKFYVNDPNLFMDFSGILDLSKKENIYDFHTKIDYANLQKLNFIKDSLSIFKGDIVIKANGNSLDNLKGDFLLTNASYQNKKDIYFIDYLNVNSSFDVSGERSVVVNSPDAIQGSLVGKYKLSQLQLMAENSMGSLYQNYKPNKVLPNQYLKFDFLFNNKIIEIFNPNISIAKNTTLKGNISSDSKNFKLDFVSPKIIAYNNTFDNLLFKVDNKNPLYSSFIQLDSIKTKYYKIRDFSMINTIVNDSLYFRSEFKGGNQGTDFYNLNFYHTINKDNKNVIGFNKSELKFKDYLWYLNENNAKENNKIVFDKKLNNFSFENLILSHENQRVSFMGMLQGKQNKDLELTFNNVELNKITPDVEKFIFDGNLNGKINFKQNNTVFQPTSMLKIDNLSINKIALGNLNLEIKGNETLSKFHLKSNLDNQNIDSFTAEGDISVFDNKTALDIDLSFDKFNLGVLGKIGGDVITNIRGFTSGNARINGDISHLDYNGRLSINDAALTIPYLNVDYKFDNNSIVDVTENKFIIRETTITDTKFDTKGTINGFIKHNQFSDWQLDLNINSKRLLALNTVDQEDTAYYGTAFINGSASIKGPTDNLMIKVDAESARGTDIKIPINNAETVQENKYIHFLTPQEKKKQKTDKSKIIQTKNSSGLELEFNFDITEIANVEVILNRESGHGMKGKGNGTLLFRINTLGKFEMFGDFSVVSGSYNFKYGGLIGKEFTVKKGASITWSGDPLAASLNLEAVYKTTANPGLLIDNPSFNKKVDVEVIIGVKGNLTNPEPDFNINFPTVSSSLKSELQYKLDDRDVRQTQALYLLSTGSFLSQDGVNQSQLSNNLYEKASSLFNDIFSGTNDKLQLGIDYVTADKTINQQTNARFGVTVSSKINDRITVNGKVGVPVGGISETAIVGDLEVQYRVNTDGTLNLRVFNRENDITYIGQGIGYTQGLGMSYEVDFDTVSELINKIFINAKIAKLETNKNNTIHDSSLLPDNMFFKDKKPAEKDRKKTIPPPNRDAIPTED